jgi:hypothetical protein
MNKKLQFYGLWPHEIAFLILAAAAFYFSGAEYRGSFWPLTLFSIALVLAIPLLAYRCLDEWRQLPNKGFFFTLAIAWVALFIFLGNHHIQLFGFAFAFVWMFNITLSPLVDEGHGLLIPFVVLVLFWWRRKELLAQPPSLWWPAIGLIVLHCCCTYAGLCGAATAFVGGRISFGLYGLTGLAWGKHWLKASFFPFFLLVFCIPGRGIRRSADDAVAAAGIADCGNHRAPRPVAGFDPRRHAAV